VLAVPTVSAVIGRRGFSYRYVAPSLWNEIPIEIRNSPFLASIEKHLKTHYYACAFLQFHHHTICPLATARTSDSAPVITMRALQVQVLYCIVFYCPDIYDSPLPSSTTPCIHSPLSSSVTPLSRLKTHLFHKSFPPYRLFSSLGNVYYRDLFFRATRFLLLVLFFITSSKEDM